jgi:YVTN family beta-propeller protein
MRLVSVVLLAGVLVARFLHAESTPREALLVLSKGGHTLAIVNPASLKVVARMPVGPDPHEVIASTDGNVAYVSNYGGGAYNALAVLDLVGQKALPSIDLGPLRGPHGLTFVAGKTWFTAEAAKAIGRYDPASKKVDWILGTGQNRTHMIFVSQDLKHIYTTNVSSGTVSIIEKPQAGQGFGPGGPPRGGSRPPNRRGPMGPPGGDWNETAVLVGKGDEGFDVSPDGKELWTANAGDGTVSVIDLASKKVAQTLAANVFGANRLKFTPDGKLALISSLSGSDLTILDAATRKQVKRVTIGHGAAGIMIQPDGKRAYVACTPDNYVAVIDLKSLAVSGHIDAGAGPDGLAWAIER